MNKNMVWNKARAMLFSGLTVLNICGTLPINAEEFVEENSYEYYEEGASSFSTNYTTIRWDDTFNTITNISIAKSDYTRWITDSIRRIDNYNGHPKTNVALKGLNKLKGELFYSITLDQPITTVNALNEMLTFELPYGVSWNASKTQWIEKDDNTIGIQIVFDIDWGKVVGQEQESCWLDIFEDSLSTLPDLNIGINIRGFKLANKLNLKSTFRIFSEVKSYSIKSADSNGLSLEYTKQSTNEDEDIIYIPVLSKKPVIMDTTITNGLPSKKAEIVIGKKRVRPNNSSNPSQNKPTIPSTPSQGPDSEDVVSILRLYNPNSGEHLFTSSPVERVQLVSIGWKNENCEWNTPSVSDNPIYRLYNPNNGDHHYTTNAAEKDMLVQVGWSYEGMPFYSARKDKGIPVYRLYNPNAAGVGSGTSQ